MRVSPLLEGAVTRQVCHFAVPAGSQPCLVNFEMCWWIGGGYSDKLKAQGLGFELNKPGKGGALHSLCHIMLK